MRQFQYLLTRSVWWLSGIALFLVLLSQGLVVYSAWDYAEKIRPIQQHLNYLGKIELADFELRKKLVKLLDSKTGYLSPHEIEEQADQIRDLIAIQENLVEGTTASLEYASNQLPRFDGSDQVPLRNALSAMRSAINQELLAHRDSLSAVSSTAREKFATALILAGGFLLIALSLWAMVRLRILLPLNKLMDQMMQLARRDYTELKVENADPMLVEIIGTFNDMAGRLKRLESQQTRRQESLRTEVRNTSYMLLQQQQRLSQAERLGAVGEMAAGIAHELRNPLTGVQMALDNIRQDLQDESMVERVELIASEVRRVNHQLNNLLNQARQRPELPAMVNVREDLEALISLLVYQLPDSISIETDIREEVECLLPKNRLHQVLLNLILNAGQAIGDQVGKISVTVSKRDDVLEIEVMDNGPGFSASLLETGIQPFLSGRADGTGLGLVMVRRTINDMGGQVELSNRKEDGANVRLTIPCNNNG